MADHINAKHFPMPLPVLPRSVKEKKQLQAQHNIASNLRVAANADVTFVGIGNLGINSPLSVLPLVKTKLMLFWEH